jgi:uracil phosphoribosyltransferase
MESGGMKEWLPWITAAIAIAGLLYQYFGVIYGMRKDMGVIKQRLQDVDCTEHRRILSEFEKRLGNENVADLSNRLTAVETKTALFWNAIGGVVTDMIKRPTHLLMDGLLDKFPNLDIFEIRLLRQELTRQRDKLVRNKEFEKALLYALKLAEVDQLAVDLGEHDKIG